MSRVDYAGLRATAVEMLRDAGQTGTLTYYTLGAYDNATLTQARTPVTVSVNVVELELPGRSDAGKTSAGAQQRWKKFLVSPVDESGSDTPEPQPSGWTLTVGAEVWSISVAKALRPGGTVVLFTLECCSG